MNRGPFSLIELKANANSQRVRSLNQSDPLKPGLNPFKNIYVVDRIEPCSSSTAQVEKKLTTQFAAFAWININ